MSCMSDLDTAILYPTYICPICGKVMTVTVYNDKDEPMMIADAECPKGHHVKLRIKKGATNQEIIDQMAYFVKVEGGKVLW